MLGHAPTPPGLPGVAAAEGVADRRSVVHNNSLSVSVICSSYRRYEHQTVVTHSDTRTGGARCPRLFPQVSEPRVRSLAGRTVLSNQFSPEG